MKTTAFIIFCLILFSCNNNNEPVIVKSANIVNKTDAVNEPYTPVVVTGMEGYYTGLFEDPQDYDAIRKITLRIDSVKNNKIYGWSIVAGNERPFSGTVQKEGEEFSAEVSEPGDNKYDGKFYFSWNRITDSIKGTWESFNKKISGAAKEYNLGKRVFGYNPDNSLSENIVGQMLSGTYNEETEKAEALTEDVLKFNASTTELKSTDVENMYKADLEIMRNSIYARHGYSFRNAKMREVFDLNTDWYIPVSTNVTSQLTPLELKNIALLKRYEKHATKYYDSFGR
jgi:hypothetical protein